MVDELGAQSQCALKVRCPQCNQKIGVQANVLGKTILCPACKTKIPIPSTASHTTAVPSIPTGSDKETIKYSCLKCKGKLENPGTMGGRDDTCPLCGASHTVPLSKGQQKELRRLATAAETETPVLPLPGRQTAVASGEHQKDARKNRLLFVLAACGGAVVIAVVAFVLARDWQKKPADTLPERAQNGQIARLQASPRKTEDGTSIRTPILTAGSMPSSKSETSSVVVAAMPTSSPEEGTTHVAIKAATLPATAASPQDPPKLWGDWKGNVKIQNVFATFTKQGRCLILFGANGTDVPYLWDSNTAEVRIGEPTGGEGVVKQLPDGTLDFRYKGDIGTIACVLRRTNEPPNPWQKDWGEFAKKAGASGSVLVCWGPTVEWTGTVFEVRPPEKVTDKSRRSWVTGKLSFKPDYLMNGGSEGSVVIDMGSCSVPGGTNRETVLTGVELFCLKDEWPIWSAASKGAKITFRGKLASSDPPVLHGLGENAGRDLWGNIYLVGTELVAIEENAATRPASQPSTSSKPAEPQPTDSSQAQTRPVDSGLPAKKSLTLDLGNNVTMTLVEIPAGIFMMGSPDSDKDRQPVEVPRHPVKISSPFYMGITHVTVNQFTTFIKDSGYKTNAEKDGWSEGFRILDGNIVYIEKMAGCSWKNPGFDQNGDHPVVQVSRRDALNFCDWLSRKSGKTVMLPTEEQWEYACRAGTNTVYPWGDNPDDGKGWANCADQSLKKKLSSTPLKFFSWDDGHVFTSPVGSFKANSFGLYDMIGNAQQCCQNVLSDYVMGTGIMGPSYYVRRGGSWLCTPYDCRSAFRLSNRDQDRTSDTGFRVVVNLEKLEPNYPTKKPKRSRLSNNP